MRSPRMNDFHFDPACSQMESRWSTRMGMCGRVSSAGRLPQMQKPKWAFLFVVMWCLLFFIWGISSSQTFFLQANLKRHTETHIKGIPWPCNICGKVSGSKSGLAQHKAKYHKDQESAMVVKVGLPILLLDSKFSFSATNGPEHPGWLHDQLFDWEARRCMGLHKVQQCTFCLIFPIIFVFNFPSHFFQGVARLQLMQGPKQIWRDT